MEVSYCSEFARLARSPGLSSFIVIYFIDHILYTTATMVIRSLSLALALSTISHISAFSPSSSTPGRITRDSALQFQATQVQDRRQVLSSLVSISGVLLPNIANAGLLDDYGTDPTQDKQPEKKKPELAKAKAKVESAVEPNLRSNYYYPTNKVRYLPRIKKCSDAIPGEYVDILSYIFLFCSAFTFWRLQYEMFCHIFSHIMCT